MKSLEKLSPQVLLSVVNTKLRNDYSSLDELCEDLNIDKSLIIKLLQQINYQYDKNLNKFV